MHTPRTSPLQLPATLLLLSPVWTGDAAGEVVSSTEKALWVSPPAASQALVLAVALSDPLLLHVQHSLLELVPQAVQLLPPPYPFWKENMTDASAPCVVLVLITSTWNTAHGNEASL